ncbi:MAG: transcription repressor NadR [Oscillospiraceae bacterium]|nr:transcription repressor NadR [Oscillospiraceae bacterium]
MNVTQRRREIVALLRQSAAPVAAKTLADRFHVSRQVIVQDMAVIRASVSGIESTYRGYILQQPAACSREFKVCHGPERMAEELNLIVDCGGHIKNISISHRVYGRVTAEMDIRSRQDVRDFAQALENSKSTLLGSATSGYHYHLVEAPSQERLDLIQRQLAQAGILAPLRPWERETDSKEEQRHDHL